MLESGLHMLPRRGAPRSPYLGKSLAGSQTRKLCSVDEWVLATVIVTDHLCFEFSRTFLLAIVALLLISLLIRLQALQLEIALSLHKRLILVERVVHAQHFHA